MRYQDVNAETIDRWIDEGWEWGKPIAHDEFVGAKNGDFKIFLTPTKPIPKEWLGDLKNKKVLGLASGGGQQMPILKALGADCAVIDYSKKQIESELFVAEREGYEIDALRGDITEKLPFGDESFDLIVHPVSNCYIKDIDFVFREAYRVLKHGGIFIGGFDTEINHIVDESETKIINAMPFDPTTNEEHRKQLEESDAGMQFSHTVAEQIGGQLKAGFVLEDIFDDTNGEGRLHELNIKTFIATRAIKK